MVLSGIIYENILNTSRIEGWLLAVNPEIHGPVHVISCIFGSYLPKDKTLQGLWWKLHLERSEVFLCPLCNVLLSKARDFIALYQYSNFSQVYKVLTHTRQVIVSYSLTDLCYCETLTKCDCAGQTYPVHYYFETRNRWISIRRSSSLLNGLSREVSPNPFDAVQHAALKRFVWWEQEDLMPFLVAPPK
jgi:hypothetical protein